MAYPIAWGNLYVDGVLILKSSYVQEVQAMKHTV